MAKRLPLYVPMKEQKLGGADPLSLGRQEPGVCPCKELNSTRMCDTENHKNQIPPAPDGKIHSSHQGLRAQDRCCRGVADERMNYGEEKNLPSESGEEIHQRISKPQLLCRPSVWTEISSRSRAKKSTEKPPITLLWTFFLKVNYGFE